MEDKTFYDNQNNMDSEKTVFDNELNNSNKQASMQQPSHNDGASTQTPPQNPKATKKIKDNTWKTIAGVGGGVAAAAAVVVGLTSMNKADDVEAKTDEDKPDWLANDDVKVAHVSDDLSFDEAFAQAREQVGPGGAFEWHGKVYGTYTASEWNAMSAAERSEWSHNFDWGKVEGESNTAHVEHADAGASTSTHTSTTYVVNEEVHVYQEEEPAKTSGTTASTQTATATSGNENHGGGETHGGATQGGEGEMEILGVYHADGYNVAELNLNGQHNFLLDIDGDTKFDVMVPDIDNDGTISDTEAAHGSDISDGNITVAALGGYTDGTPQPAEQQSELADNADYAAEREMQEGEKSADEHYDGDYDNTDDTHEHQPAAGLDSHDVSGEYAQADVYEAEVEAPKGVEADVVGVEAQPDAPVVETIEPSGVETIDYTDGLPDIGSPEIDVESGFDDPAYTGSDDNLTHDTFDNFDGGTMDTDMQMQDDLAMNDGFDIPDSVDDNFDISGTEGLV